MALQKAIDYQHFISHFISLHLEEFLVRTRSVVQKTVIKFYSGVQCLNKTVNSLL